MTDRKDATTEPDPGLAAEVDACFDRLVAALNTGMLALMISVGDRTGLFDTMRNVTASTSADIAAAAGLHERYVREWLAAMTVGGIVEHDPIAMTYTLPPAQAAALARGLGGPDSVAGMCQHVAMLGKVEDRIVDHFRHGGGIKYDTYEQLWAGDQSYELDDVDPMAVDHVLTLLPGITARLQQGIDVADIGCGWGMQLNLLARRFPASRFVGFDLSEAAVSVARFVADRHGLSNVHFQQQDATALNARDAFDLVLTFDAIHDQARPDLALQAIARSLRPEGTYVAADISGSSNVASNLADPLAVFKYTWSVMYCMTVSLAYDGMALGTVWGEERARAMMVEAGLRDPRTVHLPGDLIDCYHVASAPLVAPRR